MKTLTIKIMMMVSTMILTLKTPMSMGIMLMIQTSLSTILMSKFLSSSWMPMIVFLMLIGGLLILFMYMSSIASNEKFSHNIMIMLIVIFLIVPMEELMFETQMNETMEMLTKPESITLMKIYNEKTLMITVFMFMYLLLTMIIVTLIIKVFKGPLRSK
nr:NADH dehydrogenase subunit 6 [Selenocephalus sp.]